MSEKSGFDLALGEVKLIFRFASPRACVFTKSEKNYVHSKNYLHRARLLKRGLRGEGHAPKARSYSAEVPHRIS